MVPRVLLILAAAILAVSVLHLGSGPVEAKNNSAAPALESSAVKGGGPDSAAVTVKEAKRALKYWTPKRIASATPAPVPQGSPSPKEIVDQSLPPNGSSPPVKGAAPVLPSAQADHELRQGGVTRVISASGGSALEWTGPSTRPPATTTGLLAFIDPGDPHNPNDDQPGFCSASTVNSPAKNLVFTAAHCIHGGRDGTWFKNVVFIPGYGAPGAPYGT